MTQVGVNANSWEEQILWEKKERHRQGNMGTSHGLEQGEARIVELNNTE